MYDVEKAESVIFSLDLTFTTNFPEIEVSISTQTALRSVLNCHALI